MCDYGYNDDYGKSKYDTDVYSCSTNLFRSYFDAIANYF